MLYPIIIAGGQGTRLWPISRKNSPKQIRPFLDGESLLRKTYQRLLKSAPKENIYLSTGKSLAEGAREEVSGLPEKNIILEPTRRDTAAALGLALFRLYRRDKSAIFVYVNSDNFVKNENEYSRILELGEKIIENNPEKVLLVGIKPAYPETGYGYIRASEIFGRIGNENIYNVKEFVEKPNKETAKQYLASGEYFWNPTLIVAKAGYFLGLYKKHLPEMYEKINDINKYFGSPHEEDATEEIFPTISPISIDYGILEKEEGMLMLPANFGWMDIGHWKAIWDISTKTNEENVEIAKHLHLDSSGNLIYSKSGKLITTIGLKDMLIVETDDALMVCPKDRAQDVKKIVNKIREEGMEEYL